MSGDGMDVDDTKDVVNMMLGIQWSRGVPVTALMIMTKAQ